MGGSAVAAGTMSGSTSGAEPPTSPAPNPERLLFGRIPVGRGIRMALRDPTSVVRFLRGDGALASALGVSKLQIADWRRDLVQRAHLPSALAAQYERVTGKPLSSYTAGCTIGATNEVLYLIVRAIRPRRIVETGVAAGFSTAYLLQGLHDNQGGSLVSIDLPTTDPAGRLDADGTQDRAHVPSAGLTGFVVPPALRGPWTLQLGASKDLLPAAVEGTPLDLFIHDSDHSYDNMRWEYSTAWPHLSAGGWLLSDDIDRNAAFAELVREVRGRPFVWADGHRGGVRHP
jgi:hypothetical protein